VDALPHAFGSVLAGRYRLDSVIGKGGMGVVYRGTHLTLQSPIAVKVLTTEGALTRTAKERLIQEAQVMARLESPHIAKVLDVGAGEDGLPFVVLEYLRGKTLDAWMSPGGMAPHLAIDLILQAASALFVAHAEGVLHRDIKPQNLFGLLRKICG
jgi:eukaryotic-like serine/threonine-protein kinase